MAIGDIERKAARDAFSLKGAPAIYRPRAQSPFPITAIVEKDFLRGQVTADGQTILDSSVPIASFLAEEVPKPERGDRFDFGGLSYVVDEAIPSSDSYVCRCLVRVVS